jgi:cobalt-zinc-cadmium resistance protein CzcA
MFKPMAMTVGFAVIGTFILFVGCPMMIAMFLSKTPTINPTLCDKMMAWFENIHTFLIVHYVSKKQF